MPGEQTPEEALREAEGGFADIATAIEQALAADDDLAAAQDHPEASQDDPEAGK